VRAWSGFQSTRKCLLCQPPATTRGRLVFDAQGAKKTTIRKVDPNDDLAPTIAFRRLTRPRWDTRGGGGGHANRSRPYPARPTMPHCYETKLGARYDSLDASHECENCTTRVFRLSRAFVPAIDNSAGQRRRGGSVRTPNGFFVARPGKSRRASRPVLSSLCKSQSGHPLRYRLQYERRRR
jgi:hypothetical protein